MYIYLHEVDEELGLFGESLFEWFGVAHWRKLHVSEQRILGEDLQMLRVQISCRNKTMTSYIHTYIQIHIAPKIVRTNLRRWQRRTRR